MARVEIASQAWGLYLDPHGNAKPHLPVEIRLPGTATPATTWSALIGGTSTAGSLTTDVIGRLPGFIDEGSYDVLVEDVTYRVEAVSGTTFNADDVGSDVILIAGQSNAAGYGPVGDTVYLDPPDPRIQQYGGTGTYLGTIVTAIDPLLHHLQATSLSAGVGFGMNFARDLVKSTPPHRNVLLVPVAHSGTGFTTGALLDWSTDAGPGSLYEFAISQCNAALATNSLHRLLAILWLQGESDTSLTQSQYAAELDAMIVGWRARITGAAEVPFLIGQMVPDGIATVPSRVPINAAHIDTPRRQLKTAFVPGPSGYTEENLHYNAPGQRLMGHRFFNALPLAEANRLGAEPIAPDVVTLTQVGTTVNVTWEPPLCRATDFKVEYDAGSGWVTIAGSPSVEPLRQITGLTLGQLLHATVKTVNEEGTSAASPVASLVLDTIPGAVTGLGSIAGSHTMTLTWTPVTGARQYAAQWRTTTGPGAWSAETVVTTATATLAGLASSTSYDFRVTARNNAGDGTPSTPLTTSTTAPTFLMTDVATAAFGAWGMRRLVTGYAGSAIRVRRSSDSTELDIGFTSDVLNQSALTTFCGAGNGYIVTFYDQSGNGRDLTMATTAAQPRIVNSGVVHVHGARPAMFFDGSDDVLNRTVAGASGLVAGSTGCSMLSVVVAAASNVPFCEDNTAGGNTARWAHYIQPVVVPGWIIANDANTSVIRGGGSMIATDRHQHSIIDSKTNLFYALDGITVANAAYSRSGVYTMNRLQMGALGTGGLKLSGYIQEIVVWDSALGTTARQSGEANQKEFYTTP